MDIYLHRVPQTENHTQLRLFLRDPLKRFDILAFDVLKLKNQPWATITVCNANNALRFLQSYGGPSPLNTLVFKNSQLRFQKSNRGKPDELKVRVLLEKEADMRRKALKNGSSAVVHRTAQPLTPFTEFRSGVWDYNEQGKLTFGSKFRDFRTGTITCGKSGLVIYLEASRHKDYNWHCRIDVSYAIIEHAIPSSEGGHGTIHLTLKAPPRIYRLESMEDLHLYSGKAPGLEAFISAMERIAIAGAPAKRLKRICSIDDAHPMNASMCLVYRIRTENVGSAQRVWHQISQASGHSQDQTWMSVVPYRTTEPIEREYKRMELHLTNLLSETRKGYNIEHVFGVRYQLLAIVFEGSLTPQMMFDFIPFVRNYCIKYPGDVVVRAIRRLGEQIPTPGPSIKAVDFSLDRLVRQFTENAEDILALKGTAEDMDLKKSQHNHLVWTYKAMVTPTGLLLRGPDLNVSNRVLRKYSKYSSYFMRVFFTDEDGLSVVYDSRAEQNLVYERFRTILREGLSLAGREYSFLGFSNSSLRYHAAWFMAPFEFEGKLLTADRIIADLGDFTHIHCSAKCAARIGQAFSDTIHAFPVPDEAYVIEDKPDVERNGRCFSDGCGTISRELLQKLWKRLPPDRRRLQPTILQIRYRGAKGIISLDSSLPGKQLHVRKSMTKYVAAESWRDIEICGASYKPLGLYLNHQFIKILEDLGVPPQNFLSVQKDAMGELKENIENPINAASFLEVTRSGIAAKIPSLVKLLYYIGIPFQADKFLTDIFEVALMASLRDLKYRARIPVREGYLLYGIMDETGELKEGEVHVSVGYRDKADQWRREILVGDRVVVTRAPALHPGDIQVVKAVDVAPDSPLKELFNCIIFSQHGARDLPSQLGGGDLDGDLFHIIYDDRLIPPRTVTPSEYKSAPAKDLGRSVNVLDIADFFIEYMASDVLGQVSNKHKVRADARAEGTMHSDCIVLSELASDAVDFSKSGNPVDMRLAPKGNDRIRPDFMAHAPDLVLNLAGTPAFEENDPDDAEDPDSISILDPERAPLRFYRSQKILGELYRKIDQSQFVAYMKNAIHAHQDQSRGAESAIQRLERYIDRETKLFQWEHHRGFAEELREYYEENMLEIMATMRPHRGKSLTELEVVSGNVLGKKERASTRYTREANIEVQERFSRDVSAITRRIVSGDDGDDQNTEALPRAVACFKVALETEGWEDYGSLRSWKYVAGAGCLEQLWKYMNCRLRPL